MEGRKIDETKKEEREEWMKGKKGGRKMKKKKQWKDIGRGVGSWAGGREKLERRVDNLF